jgi:predicted NUDIX family NTP pyrophosphohydrolase
MYRFKGRSAEVFLVHPGGPFWVRKDRGAWSIPKGEFADAEQPLEAAKREFQEETGFIPLGSFIDLGSVRQAGGKIVSAWAFQGDCDPAALVSNHCEMEWPPRSGRQIDFPEVDRGAWFQIPEARERILKSQEPFLNSLSAKLGEPLASTGQSGLLGERE